MNNQPPKVVYYNAWRFNPATNEFDIWLGIATLTALDEFDEELRIQGPIDNAPEHVVDGWVIRTNAANRA